MRHAAEHSGTCSGAKEPGIFPQELVVEARDLSGGRCRAKVVTQVSVKKRRRVVVSVDAPKQI